MRVEDLDIRELLEVDVERGEVRFAGRQVLILDAVAMGLLRKQLVDSFGATAARAVLTRLGFLHGWRMAEAMHAEFTWDREEDWRNAGGLIHMLLGHIRLATGSDPLSARGATLEVSYEAEQHLLHFGQADSPVCWMLCGVGSGYLSRAVGEEIFVLEDRCRGQGDAACHVRGRTRAQWGEALVPHLPFFQEGGVEALLPPLSQRLKRTERELQERRRALARLAREPEDPSGLITRSPTMRQALELARRVAKVESTVLLTGESGVGKERLARLIHDESARAAGPFLALNCGALTETLLESELFGHARGAFTGAVQDRPGLFEAASGGTLFLDEVGELPLGMQARLLRALQERQVRRVGENHHRPIQVRILAATNRELSEEVAGGRFRKDLYYRLRVIELRVPPLRERREDVLPLARVLLAEAAQRMGRTLSGLSAQAADQLVRHDWPGNVRELANAMERAAALARGRRVDLEDLPEDVRQAPPRPGSSGGVQTLEALEKAAILDALERNGGHQVRTAAQLGIGVTTLYRKLKRYQRPGGQGGSPGVPASVPVGLDTQPGRNDERKRRYRSGE